MEGKETKILTTPYARNDAWGALAMPIYHVAAFEFPSAKAMADAFCGRSMAHSYSRISNPTVQHLERRVQQLTGALSVTALNTGMAAISHALIGLAGQGLNIIISPYLFGNSISLIRDTLGPLGVEVRYADLFDMADVEQKIDEKTCAVFFEIISNPQLYVVDVKALAQVAHAHGVPIIADTTVIPFTEFRSADLGVDIEVVSSTKYVSGGATSLGGLLIDNGRFDWAKSNSPTLQAKARRVGGKMAFTARLKTEIVSNLGALMSPHAAYMQTLGLETLSLRFRRQSESAAWLAGQLQEDPRLQGVTYPGLPSNAFYSRCREQFGPLSGAMLTIDLVSREAAFDFIDRLQVVHRATNLFDNRSLAIHPASTIFGLFTEEQRAQMDVRPTTVRLSIGLEDPQDLLHDIQQALG